MKWDKEDPNLRFNYIAEQNMTAKKNILQMYMENDYQFGFHITRNSWHPTRYATVQSIDGVEEGKPIEGQPPYFVRYYPEGHAKAGKVWKRWVHMDAHWTEEGIYDTDCGGNYSWTRVYPEELQ